MLFNTTPAEERRIYNWIWNGAAQYGFEPDFAATDFSGQPDFYRDLMIGLSIRFFGRARLARLFSLWDNRFSRATYDQLAWIALENAAYARELPHRPALAVLRREAARRFVAPERELQRRRFALRSPQVYRLRVEEARTCLFADAAHAEMLTPSDLPRSLMTPRDRALYRALQWDETVEPDEIIPRLTEIFQRYLHFTPRAPSERATALWRFWQRLALLTPGQLERSSKPGMIEFSGRSGARRASRSLFVRWRLLRRQRRDDALASLYGRSLFSEEAQRQLERRFCTGAHRRSSLWFTDGDKKQGRFSAAQAYREKLESALYERNRARYEQRARLYERAIRTLSDRIDAVLPARDNAEDRVTRYGNLLGRLAWKSALPDENRIFSRHAEASSPDFAVDLLLDASASRLAEQTDVAIQAYILAASLTACNIEVQVIAFQTVNDSTLFTVLKQPKEAPKKERIFRYHAEGWNRDGLAYRGVQALIRPDDRRRHLLLILTDADPNDLKPLWRDRVRSTSYDGKAALQDAEEALHALRRRHFTIGGILTGADTEAENARRLFGRQFVRIQAPEQLASAGAAFVQREIGRLERT